ncbi:ATP-binding protein [Sedimenticola sp.]|uniref:ATP-binding protein n=1 Tax=Sedimenticola sp. TaxID=1940285 RepID=UPI003D1014C2
MDQTEQLLQRAQQLIERLEKVFSPAAQEPNWSCIAYRWQQGKGLQAIARPHKVQLDDILCVDLAKAEITRNTRQFVEGRSANNTLLWGSRGTGKSSLIKALLNEFADRGLRLIEVEKQDLIDLPAIVEQIQDRPERFLLYCDDLSFEADDASYKSLKAILDGSISAPPENVLIYATSNRRHLLPEFKQENQDVHIVEGEIHQNESVEEKISLSERFGLWLSFYPFSQDQYLSIVDHWLSNLGAETTTDEQTRLEALRFALKRGSRSGRVALQFARDWAGRLPAERPTAAD